MIYLTLEELVHVATRAFGAPAAVRDAGLLESALARPRASVFGVDAYADLEEQAAALVHSLVRNHALIDGNKRLGLIGLVVFLRVNGARLTFSNDEAYAFIMEIADAHIDDISEISSQLRTAVVDEATWRARSA